MMVGCMPKEVFKDEALQRLFSKALEGLIRKKKFSQLRPGVAKVEGLYK